MLFRSVFPPDWDEGCPHCSFWADSFDGTTAHLNARDVTMVAISRAPQPKLAAYAKRMGWTFPWFSSGGTDFNHDFGVAFTVPAFFPPIEPKEFCDLRIGRAISPYLIEPITVRLALFQRRDEFPGDSRQRRRCRHQERIVFR